MEKYFLDTEFVEGVKPLKFLGWTYGESAPTIDLLSIGVVSNMHREYYAINKEADWGYAWERCQIENGKKVYWIRENVLKPIWFDLEHRESLEWRGDIMGIVSADKEYFRSVYLRPTQFSLRRLKYLVQKYGKTRSELQRELRCFFLLPAAEDLVLSKYSDPGTTTYYNPLEPRQIFNLSNDSTVPMSVRLQELLDNSRNPVTIWAYFADYDWVVFCWIFGCMLDLPKGFPWYCKDLKQWMDEKVDEHINRVCHSSGNHTILDFDTALADLKASTSYPKVGEEHHALADARWNKALYEFLLACG